MDFRNPPKVSQKPWWHNAEGKGMNPSAFRIDHDTGEPGQFPWDVREDADKCWRELKRRGWVD